MQRILATFIVTVLVCTALPVLAQTTPSPQAPRFMDEAHRTELYDQGKLSKIEAVGWSLLLPGAGNIYAEQYFVGAAILTAVGFSLTFLGYGLVTDQDKFLIYAAIGGGASYATGIVTSILAVDDYNDDLARALKVDASLRVAPTIGWSWQF